MQPLPGSSDATLTREMPATRTNGDSPLVSSTTIVAPGEACPSCRALLAADQRYCVECGERIGDPRLPFMDGRTEPEPTQPQLPAYPVLPYNAPPTAPKGKWSSTVALLGTIGVLLLSMGVGVLIGDKNGGGASTAAQQPVIIGAAGVTDATAGASGATGGTDAATANAATGSDGETKSGVDANALAKKNGVKLAPPSVDLGEDCPKGSVGCDEKGKFTGDYFE